jgi:phosphoglycolate phosphatase
MASSMPKGKTTNDLLIFDLDGTLVDTRRDLANAVNYALRQLGKDEIDLDTITGYVGDGIRKLLERALGNAVEADLETARQHFRFFYQKHIADFSQLYPGLGDVLQHFQSKKKAVLTNKPQEFTEALLRRLDIYHHFEMIVGGQRNLKLKPDPEGVRLILTRLNASPSQAVIIGDSENDILTGKAAGIATCAVTYGFRPAEKLRALKPDFVVGSPTELISSVI